MQKYGEVVFIYSTVFQINVLETIKLTHFVVYVKT